MKKVSLLIGVLLGCFALTACSFVSEFYMVNTTGKAVQATFYFNYSITERLKENRTFPLRYDTIVVEKVNSRTASLLKQNLGFELINDRTISIDIPAHSTVFFSKGINRPNYGDSVRLILSAGPHTMDEIELQRKMKYSGAFSPKYFSYYIK